MASAKMKTLPGCIMLVAFAIVVSPWARAEEADATFKTGVAQLYKDWIFGRPFLVAYDVRESAITKGKVVVEQHREVRIAWDAATQRVIWEQHEWPIRDEPATYTFVRWDGKQMISGSSPMQRVVRVAGKQVTNLADSTVGVPLCTTVTINDTMAIGSALVFGIPTMTAAGFALDGKSMEVRLTEVLKDPRARLEHLDGTGPDDLTLSLPDKRIVFDARRGLIKESQGFSGIHLRRVVNQFVDQVPVDITMIEDYAKDQAQNRTEFKAIPGQCRVLSAQEFEDLMRLELPSDITVRHLRRRPPIAAPAIGK